MGRMIPFLACVPLLLSLLFTSHLSRGSFNRDKPPKSTFRTKGPLQGDKPAIPMEVELSFSDIPLLNQIAVLNLSVTPLRDAPNTTIMFDLPAKAFKVISGETKMTENISAGETRVYSIEVLPIALGQYALVGNAISKQGTFVFGRRSELFVSLDNEWTTRTSRTD